MNKVLLSLAALVCAGNLLANHEYGEHQNLGETVVVQEKRTNELPAAFQGRQTLGQETLLVEERRTTPAFQGERIIGTTPTTVELRPTEYPAGFQGERIVGETSVMRESRINEVPAYRRQGIISRAAEIPGDVVRGVGQILP